MYKFFKISLYFLFAAGLVLAGSFRAQAEGLTGSNVVINEIQTGGLSDAKDEFIEIYNPSGETLDISGWSLDYVSASGLTMTPLYAFGGELPANSIIILAHDGYYQDKASGFFGIGDGKSSGVLAGSGGHVRLKDADNNIVDLIGWGSAANPETEAVAAIPAGSSAERLINCTANLPQDTDDNNSDFVLNAVPSPGVLGSTLTNGCDTGSSSGDAEGDNPSDDPHDDTGGHGAGPQSSCKGLIISELLVNPAGSDTGHEFIELYNPSEDFISLTGCKLQTSASSKMYEFSDGQIDPGRYIAFYNDKTGLTLANSSGGSVYLIDTDNTEIYQADYPADLDDDVSWSLLGGSWSKTFRANQTSFCSQNPAPPDRSETRKPTGV